MKVLIVTSHFQPAWDWGGPVRSLWNLARGLVGCGVETTVITTNASQRGTVDVPRERIQNGVLIITSSVLGGGLIGQANRQGISPSMWMNIYKYINDADIIHINGIWGPIPSIAARCSAMKKKPYIISLRGALEKRSLDEKAFKKKAALVMGVKRIIKNATALHYTTEMEKGMAPAWANHNNAIVVPNSVEFPKCTSNIDIRARYRVGEDTVMLGAIGRMHPRKGYDILIPALSAAISKADLILVVVGPDEAQYRNVLNNMIRSMNISSRVHFAGELTGKELSSVYQAIDILVLPSHGESFGNVIIEAAAHGTPSFVSENVGLKKWVEDNNIGRVLKLNVEEWTNAIRITNREEIKSRWNPDRLASLSRECFSIDSVARSMQELYERAIRIK